MFLYMITNNINDKKYIGITIDYISRWKQHQKLNKSLISRAINKYGKENFIFSLLHDGLSIEEAESLEKEYIKKYNTIAPNGYNIAKGGLYAGPGQQKITEEDIVYIKNHRNIPLYLLYEQYSEKISYGYFKQIYNDYVRKDIVPTVEKYPNNTAFSCQFTKTKLTYNDILDMRESYNQHKSWDEVYPKYSNKVAKSTFIEIYNGRSFKLIRPEVFTPENKHEIMKKSNQGEKNSNAKLTKEEVLKIREFFNQGLSVSEIQIKYPQVSKDTIRDIIKRKTWKYI